MADQEKMKIVYDAILSLEEKKPWAELGVTPGEIFKELNSNNSKFARSTMEKYLGIDLIGNKEFSIEKIKRGNYMSDNKAKIKGIIDKMINSSIIQEADHIEIGYIHDKVKELVEAYPNLKDIEPSIFFDQVEEWFKETHEFFVFTPRPMQFRTSFNRALTESIIRVFNDLSIMIGSTNTPLENDELQDQITVLINFNPKKFEFKDPREEELEWKKEILKQLKSKKKI